MATLRQYASLVWMDSAGRQRTQFVHTADNPEADVGPFAGVMNAAQTLSSAQLVSARLSPATLFGGTGTAGPYASVLDYCKIQLRSAAGELVDFNLPAPIGTIFGFSGGDRLDLEHDDVVTLVEALIAAGASSSGSPIVSAVRGKRLRVRR